MDIRKELPYAIRAIRSATTPRRVSESVPTDAELAGEALLHHASFRLPDQAGHDRLIGFRVWFRTISRMRSSAKGLELTGHGGTSLILNSHRRNAEMVRRYIEISSRERTAGMVFKDDCGALTSGFLVSALSLSWFAAGIAFRCLFAANRANRALLIREALEMAWLMAIVRHHGITRLYDFIPYEVDSNLQTLLLRTCGAEIVKIPSSSPLATHNKVLIADTVIFSTAYHYEELAAFRETIRVGTIELWPPERAFTYMGIYSGKPAPPAGTIGYYSHAEWVREEEGHRDNGMEVGVTEERILQDLCAFLESHPETTLTLFLHPREKQDKWILRTQAHYAARLPANRYVFAPRELPSAHGFHLVDIAVVSYSTIIFERLFAGYKLLIGNYSIPGFPIPGSPLEGITFRNRDQLHALLEQSAGMSDDAFFDSNGLKGYPASDNPGLLKLLAPN